MNNDEAFNIFQGIDYREPLLRSHDHDGGCQPVRKGAISGNNRDTDHAVTHRKTGSWINDMGVTDPVYFKKITVEAVASAITECISNDRYRKKAVEISKKLESVDGVELTVQYIEKEFGG